MLDATLRDQAKGLLAASGRSEVPPFMVMDVMAAAARIEAAGGHVIHMEVGQPSAPAPRTALDAAHAALERGQIDYTSALGIPSLRARIARHYRETYGCEVDPDRIVVTTGSSGAFILAFLAMFEPGDRIAVTVPGYPPYRHILTALGCEPVLIETSSENRHALTGEALLAAHRKKPLKGVLVGSPANPTGTMMSREALTQLMAAAESEGIRFISDEIYHGLDYAFPAVTAAELSPHALVINSFSKYFCMTGWRVGWMVVPEPLVRPIERLQQNLSISVPTLLRRTSRAAVTRLVRSVFMSTRSICSRASSASRRDASEISVIRRSRRRTSCWMMSSRRLRDSSVLASGRVSTALRSEVRGFFNSWLTSAAKLSMASIRV